MIKLLIGGSPCTFWSIAQKNERETEAKGMGWELFKNYLVAKDKFKPDFFLYENNKSASQPIKDQISKELGVDLMYINSALVSAQNRQRFYAFNWEVEQPEDRGILLRDILESGEAFYTANGGKSFALPSSYYKTGENPFSTFGNETRRQRVAEPVKCLSDAEMDYMVRPTKDGRNHFDFDHFHDGNQDKSRCITATTAKGVPYNVLCEPVGVGYRGRMEDGKWVKRYESNGEPKANALTTVSTDSMVGEPIKAGTDKTIYEVKDGLITIKDKQYPIKLADGHYIIRKLTPVECERLQTLPDGYTKAVSNTQRYRGLGNGWTAEVIIHILNGALKDVPRDEEIVVLSMYDGIGTGRYCLDKMGFTNVKYFAYEIDKYAKQVALSNYPDIIHMGDAFDLRHPDWTIDY